MSPARDPVSVAVLLEALERSAGRIRKHYPTVFELGFEATSRGRLEGSRSGTSDPTLAVVENPQKQSARFAAERTVGWVQEALELVNRADRRLADVLSPPLRARAIQPDEYPRTVTKAELRESREKARAREEASA